MMRWLNRNAVICVTADLFNKADIKLDIQDTKLPDESYDLVICNHVLEHVDNFRTALSELYRIIRTGGALICSFPMDPSVELLDEETEPLTAKERLDRFGQNDHRRVFGMNADQFIIEAGFEVERIVGSDCPNDIKPVVGPANYDMNILFYARKKLNEIA